LLTVTAKFIQMTLVELGIVLVLWVVITRLMTGELPTWSLLTLVAGGWLVVALARLVGGRLLARRRRV
jgi:hypothetical protein